MGRTWFQGAQRHPELRLVWTFWFFNQMNRNSDSSSNSAAGRSIGSSSERKHTFLYSSVLPRLPSSKLRRQAVTGHPTSFSQKSLPRLSRDSPHHIAGSRVARDTQPELKNAVKTKENTQNIRKTQNVGNGQL